MIKFHIHDFNFEEFKINNLDTEHDFCVAVAVYFNFSPEDPGDGWENLTLLDVFVANQ